MTNPKDEVPWTAGPWTWTDAYPATDNRATFSLVGADGYGILSCDGLANSPQHTNRFCAALIAEAPTMAALLEELVDYEAAMQGEEWMQKQPIYVKARELLARIGRGK